jgi:transketolase
MNDYPDTREFAKAIRLHALKMVHAAKASHIGGVLSMADVLAVLYSHVLEIRPEEPEWPDRDRFILSKGHCCAGVYAALALRGFIPLDELQTYGAAGSRLMTHVSHKVPGVEFSTGSLGHGLPFGTGKALAASRKGAAWRTFVLLSDGELDEGSNWEAALFAAHHDLDNLTVIVDYNKIQSLGAVEEVIRLEPLVDKFQAFGWAVREVDGHDLPALESLLALLPLEAGKPSLILAHTIKGKGVPFMENNLLWHYRNPDDEKLRDALSSLEYDS